MCNQTDHDLVAFVSKFGDFILQACFDLGMQEEARMPYLEAFTVQRCFSNIFLDIATHATVGVRQMEMETKSIEI